MSQPDLDTVANSRTRWAAYAVILAASPAAC